MEEKVKAFLELATQKKASDIFIIAGRPLSVKIDGKLCTLDGFEERLMPPETDEFIRIIYKLAHDRNIEPMLETGDDDFSMAIPGLSRFRVIHTGSVVLLPLSSVLLHLICLIRRICTFLQLLWKQLILPREWF